MRPISNTSAGPPASRSLRRPSAPDSDWSPPDRTRRARLSGGRPSDRGRTSASVRGDESLARLRSSVGSVVVLVLDVALIRLLRFGVGIEHIEVTRHAHPADEFQALSGDGPTPVLAKADPDSIGAIAEKIVECLKQRPPDVIEPTLAEAPAQLGHLVGVFQRLDFVAREDDEGA